MMQSNKLKGILFTMTAAIMFGITPVFARISYEGGNNGINMTFLRSLLALPILFVILKAQGIQIKPTKSQLKHLLLAGGLGTTLTTILLYVSYSYISVGMSTTLHFIYPLLVALGCALFFKEPMNKWIVSALVIGMIGILLFLERDGSPVGLFGVILSLLSGVTYAFYVIWIDKSGLKDLNYFLLTFYLSLVMTVCTLPFAIATGSLTFNMTANAWFNAFLVSILTSVVAMTTFQLGLRYIGATSASILSTMEPISSIILGVLVLGEVVTVAKLFGCVLILVSVILIARSPQPSSSEESPQV